MTALPLLPKGAPFSPEQIDLLNDLVGKSSALQRSWLAGFLAGVEASLGAPHPAAPPKAKTPLTILYGTESGNSESLAMKARKTAQKLGFDARILDMADAEPAMLAKAANLVVIAATWGEGEPPQRAADFYKGLMSDAAPRLDGVRFGVLALGDTTYVNFCSVGQAIDARLEALGASRATPRADLDLDFAKKANAWTDEVLKTLAPAEPAASDRVVHVDFKGGDAKSAAHPAAFEEPSFTQDNPLEAEITALVNLSGTGSTRETWHVELAMSDSGLSYEPGDAIGVVPENDPELAAAVLEAVGLGGDPALARRLQTSHDITALTRTLVQAYAKLTGRADVAKLAEPPAFAAYAADRQILDLFAEHAEPLNAEQLTGLLRPLPARLYSVASSLAAHEGEAHLLVGAVRWHSHGKDRRGVASSFLADRRRTGDNMKIYVKPNRHFRLPTDGQRPIIMIGAGTGIAPYRGFIEERAETAAKGRSWLFFGERSFTNDFLYQLEWQDFLTSGALSRIDLAFSRDQPEKIYVQHRLWQHRAELSQWIDDGAHLYVCGDEKGMAKDVDATLVRILGEADKGAETLAKLRKAGRYQRDVY